MLILLVLIPVALLFPVNDTPVDINSHVIVTQPNSTAK